MRKSAPVEIAVCAPETEEGRLELKRRVAQCHAQYVLETVGALKCPISQKRELLQTVMEAVRARGE